MSSSLTPGVNPFGYFGDGDQIASQWPAGIDYSGNQSKYVYSVSPDWQISPLDHFHIIDIDVPQVGITPNEMVFTVPRIASLPMESRIYFFYVSQANSGDIFTFEPVVGSGDTINGNALGFSLVATGKKELIIAIAVNQNYVIHSFGRNNDHAEGLIPTVSFDYDSGVTPIDAVSYGNQFFTGISALYPGLDATAPELVVVPGMEGYITPNVTIPGKTFQGFRCNKTGYYLVDTVCNVSGIYTHGALLSTVTNRGAYATNFAHFDDLGAYVNGREAPCYVPLGTNANMSNPTYRAPMVLFNAPSNPVGVDLPTPAFLNPRPTGSRGISFGTSAFSPENMRYWGSEGLIVPNTVVGGTAPAALSGFLCLDTGLYRLSYEFLINLVYSITSATNNGIYNISMYEVDNVTNPAVPTATRVAIFPVYQPSTTTLASLALTYNVGLNTAHFINLTANRI